MRITIIKDDKVVTIDGVSFTDIDMSSAPSDLHALQWYGDAGDMELCDPVTRRMQNVAVTSLDLFEGILAQCKTDNP